MGRGPTLKTLRKKAEAAAYGTTLGRLKAEQKIKDENMLEKPLEGFMEMLKKADPVDAALYGGLAYMSWKANLTPLWGPIALKLATQPATADLPTVSFFWGATSIDLPLSSQYVGLAMLGVLGAVPVLSGLSDVMKNVWKSQWDTMNCDEKRTQANLCYYVLSPSAPPFESYMEGWQDMPYGTPSQKYLDCRAAINKGVVGK